MSEMITPGINDERLFNNELEFVEALVKQYQLAITIPSRKRSRLPDLVKTNLKSFKVWIEEAYRYYQESSTSDINISLSAEWILDNFYILQQAFQNPRGTTDRPR